MASNLPARLCGGESSSLSKHSEPSCLQPVSAEGKSRHPRGCPQKRADDSCGTGKHWRRANGGDRPLQIAGHQSPPPSTYAASNRSLRFDGSIFSVPPNGRFQGPIPRLKRPVWVRASRSTSPVEGPRSVDIFTFLEVAEQHSYQAVRSEKPMPIAVFAFCSP